MLKNINEIEDKIIVEIKRTITEYEMSITLSASIGCKHEKGEWSIGKHGAGKRRTWRKLHPAIDTETDRLSGKISMEWGHDSKFLGPLLNPLHIKQILGDGAGHESLL
ncbi:hypothetical protein [Desulfotalea psychrophila]|uniref:Related to transposase n=1 Tax=Desulfotalea psychrophila (strain LSv54 / DSM 12343) TaxID=177439 RepID=Q6AKM8_DESPS|nr:hypothetical protein [Desulfotalea psychrophila]CAG37097.1 related to transposase [Desulfotalea psychrophila LSv54]